MARGRLHCWRVSAGGARRAVVQVDRRRPFHDSRHAADSSFERPPRTGPAARMIRIALTGSIGMGKSTVAKMFEAAGVPVFDADAEVRKLQGEGGALVEAIGGRFPGSVSDGIVDRERLAKLVLEDR